MHPHGLLHHSTVILILIYFSATDGFLNDKNERANVDSRLARRIGECTPTVRSSVTTKDRLAQNRRTTLGNGNCDGNNNHIKERSPSYRLSNPSERTLPQVMTRRKERYSSDAVEYQLRRNANNFRTVTERSSRITGVRNEARRLNFDTNTKSTDIRATERQIAENVIRARRVTDGYVETTGAPSDLIRRNIDANGNRRHVSSDRTTPERSLGNRRYSERKIGSDRIVASEKRMPKQSTSNIIKETIEISSRVIRSRNAAPNQMSVRRKANTLQTKNGRSSERRISVANSNSGATIRSSRRNIPDVRLASVVSKRDATETHLTSRRNPDMQRCEARPVQEFGKRSSRTNESVRRYLERSASKVSTTPNSNEVIEKNQRLSTLKVNKNVRRNLVREVTSRASRSNERSANLAEIRVSSRRNPTFDQSSFRRSAVDLSMVNANSDATVGSSRRVITNLRLVSNDQRDTTEKQSPSRRNQNSKQNQRSEQLGERSRTNNNHRFSERRVSKRSAFFNNNEERLTRVIENRRFSEPRFNEVRDANVIGTRRNLAREDISARASRSNDRSRAASENQYRRNANTRTSERQMSIRRNVDREITKNPSNVPTSSRLVDRTRDVKENAMRRNMKREQVSERLHRASNLDGITIRDRRFEDASDVRSSKLETERRTNQSLNRRQVRSNNEETRRNVNMVNAHLDVIAIYRNTRDVTRRTMQRENIVRKSSVSPIIEITGRNENKLSRSTERRAIQRRILDENVRSKQTIIRRFSDDVFANERRQKTRRMVSAKQQPTVEEFSWGNVAKMLLLTVTLVQILGSTDPKKYGFCKLTNFLSYAKQKVL